jgi:hypothetical protein
MSKKTVTTSLDELLKPLGFARHKATWNRQQDPFVDVIDVQASKGGDTITINAGVLHRGVHQKCWLKEPPACVQEPECTVRTRAGQLIDGRDLWWRKGDPRIAEDVIENVNVSMLPFLERMHSLEAMEKFLAESQLMKPRFPDSASVVYLAILKDERGDKAGACALLTELGNKTLGDWKTRMREVAERLSCPAS